MSAARDRFRSLIDVGVALSAEKELDRIIDLIIDKAIEATQADAAYIFLVENLRASPQPGDSGPKTTPYLRFHRSVHWKTGKANPNRILVVDDSSIAGHVVMTGESVSVEDCYNLSPDLPFKFNPKIDNEMGYRSVSMLAVPIAGAQGKTRGVLELMNKHSPQSNPSTSNQYVPFTDEDRDVMQAFAGQASVALENARLTGEIEGLFESFIRASVTAIEARDLTTSGHSDRVAVLTVEFARAVHNETEGPYKSHSFTDSQIRELRYASLLHDFGKIGVPETVLNKQLKLHPHELESLLLRLDSAKAKQETLAWRKTVEHLVQKLESGVGLSAPRGILQEAQRKVAEFAKQVADVRLSIVRANQPQMLESEFDIAGLIHWLNQASREIEETLIKPEELLKLSLARGTLTESERRDIESHVSHTYHFLRQIAWTEDLSEVPEIAHGHHEKLDGSGYPRGATSESIPLQSKLMTIADIYDALTSMDRPYKPAMPPQQALEVLHFDAKAGKLDLDLLRIFIEAEVFRSTVGMRR